MNILRSQNCHVSRKNAIYKKSKKKEIVEDINPNVNSVHLPCIQKVICIIVNRQNAIIGLINGSEIHRSFAV